MFSSRCTFGLQLESLSLYLSFEHVLFIIKCFYFDFSLVRRFVENKFDENHDVTIGMDFKTAVMNVDSIDYKVALWDTAGAERFRSLTPSFYRKALGAILVYDITNRDTLVKLEAWLEELNSYSDNPNIAIIVVGNKIDKDRVVDREEGRKFARKHRALFIETSAKCDQFVSDAFKDIVEKVSRLSPLNHSLCLCYYLRKLIGFLPSRLFPRNTLAAAATPTA